MWRHADAGLRHGVRPHRHVARQCAHAIVRRARDRHPAGEQSVDRDVPQRHARSVRDRPHWRLRCGDGIWTGTDAIAHAGRGTRRLRRGAAGEGAAAGAEHRAALERVGRGLWRAQPHRRRCRRRQPRSQGHRGRLCRRRRLPRVARQRDRRGGRDRRKPLERVGPRQGQRRRRAGRRLRLDALERLLCVRRGRAGAWHRAVDRPHGHHRRRRPARSRFQRDGFGARLEGGYRYGCRAWA